MDGKEGHACSSATASRSRGRPEDVWRAIGTPERWFEGYLETRSRSEGYPGPDTRDDHLYRTRTNEQVGARVTRSEAPSVLEEDQEGKTCSRHVRYRLTPSPTGTSVRVEDDVSFKVKGAKTLIRLIAGFARALRGSRDGLVVRLPRVRLAAEAADALQPDR